MKPQFQIPDQETLKRLYRSMMLIRLVEERVGQEYPKNEMKCPVHLSIGQEACAVGVCDHLTKEDIVFSTHRCHAHYLAKGGDLKKMVAEMYGKETGCANGRGGSMHLVDTACGFYGTSAIVCGSLPLPVGVALRFKQLGARHVSVAFFGDAAVEPGVFHECMNFAGYHRLPVLFVCEDNDYSTMTRRYERQHVTIEGRAAGYGVQAMKVDGNDLLMVHKAAGEAIACMRATGNGPYMLVLKTYRHREHVEHNTSIMKRPEEDLLFWKQRDPVTRFQQEVVGYGVQAHDLHVIDDEIDDEVDEAFLFAKSDPVPMISEILRGIGDEVESFDEPPRPSDGRSLTCANAIAEATVQAMQNDLSVSVFGLHVTDPNGIFGTTVPAAKAFPDRVFETPIMEASMTSILGGAAMMGMRPLHVHARNDFLLLCLSQLGNELSKWHYMTAGALSVPLVIRAIVGRSRGQGPQHSQSLQSLFAYFPGMHVVAPSNAFDAKGLLLTAFSEHVPVIYLEHRLCHPMDCPVPEEAYRIPFGKARIVREGTDVTIVTLLQSVYEAERAAGIIAEEGIRAEVIDLRSIRPWDKDTVCASVRKTGRLIMADTGWVEFGISAEICTTVSEREFSSLKAPSVRIGNVPCPTPTSEILENAYYPGSREIALAAYRLLQRDPPRRIADGFATEGITGPF